MYTVVMYEKDNDNYIEYDVFDNETKAIGVAMVLQKIADKGMLKTQYGEPIDWIGVYYNYNMTDERTVWVG